MYVHNSAVASGPQGVAIISITITKKVLGYR